MKKLARLSQSPFLELEKLKLAATKGALTQEKPGNFSKNSELCGILTYPSPIRLLSKSVVALK